MTAVRSGTSPRLQLGVLDGLRGFAALAVAVYHAMLYATSVGEQHAPAVFTRVLGLGQYGVAVFIVLSGFVLALPVSRTPGLELNGGTSAFLRRRARRILPPYYAALALFTVLILLIPGLDEPSGTEWDSKVPVDLRSVLTHLVLIQNLDPHSAFRIDGPMWSVATEWQIYSLPFLLIPLWRRFGPLVVTVVALVIGLGLHAVVPTAHPVYLGLFAFGLLAASLVGEETVSAVSRARRCALLFLSLGVAAHLVAPGHPEVIEPLIGAGAAAGVLALVWNADGRRAPLRALLESRSAVRFGLFSYSFYLVHSPILAWLNLATRHLEMSAVERWMGLVAIGIPLAAMFAFAFYWCVERHFMSGHMKVVAEGPLRG